MHFAFILLNFETIFQKVSDPHRYTNCIKANFPFVISCLHNSCYIHTYVICIALNKQLKGGKTLLYVFWNIKGGVLVDFKVYQALLRLNHEKN